MQNLGFATSTSQWEELELYGIILEDDVAQNLGDFWKPEGRVANGYYWPEPELDIDYIDIDTIFEDL